MISFQMSKEQRKQVSLVRQLAQEEIAPLALEMDQAQGDFNWHYIDVLAKHNLIAPIIPLEYGGRGLDCLTIAMFIEEIAVACAGLAAAMVGTMHAVLPIIIGGTEEQKEKFLPLLTGKQAALASFALTEPQGGSDIEILQTTADFRENVFLLNGVKDYVINGAVAKFVTVCANSNPAAKRAFQFFFVSSDQIKVNLVRNTMGIKYANTAQIAIDNVKLDKQYAIGERDSGYLLLTHTLDIGRTLIAAIEVGIARAAYQLVLQYARERQQFGRPIFSNQGVSFPLAAMATSIDAARLMVWRACDLIDKEEDFTQASSMAKMYASEVAQHVTAGAIDIIGAAAYDTNHIANVYFRDAKVCSIVGGTNNIQKMIISSLL
jgi:alkylation response protein AidB-like acyl-CoA dehydrogenase